VPGVQPPGILATRIARAPAVQVEHDARPSRWSARRPAARRLMDQAPPKAAPRSRRAAGRGRTTLTASGSQPYRISLKTRSVAPLLRMVTATVPCAVR